MVYTLGETGLDIIYKEFDDVKIKPGGSMLNTAVSLGRLGIEVGHISILSFDKASDILIDYLNNNAISTDFILRVNSIKTNLALSFLDIDNNANYTFYKDELHDSPQLVFPEVQLGDTIYFGSSFSFKRNIRKQLIHFIKTAKAKGAHIVYDPNFRDVYLPQLPELLPFIEQNFELSDVVKASNEDMQNIFGAQDAQQAWERLKIFDVKLLIYTEGAKGAKYVCDKIIYNKNAKNIKTLSTIGAGDTFSVGIIYYLINNGFEKLICGKASVAEELLNLAHNFSAEVCQSYDNYLSVDYAKNFINV